MVSILFETPPKIKAKKREPAVLFFDNNLSDY